jgi:hypothetical protein
LEVFAPQKRGLPSTLNACIGCDELEKSPHVAATSKAMHLLGNASINQEQQDLSLEKSSRGPKMNASMLEA